MQQFIYSSSVNWRLFRNFSMYKELLFVLLRNLFIYLYVLLCVLFISLRSVYFINLWKTLIVLPKNQQYHSKSLECNICFQTRKSEEASWQVLALEVAISAGLCVYMHTRKLFIVRKQIRIRWEINIHMPGFIPLFSHQPKVGVGVNQLSCLNPLSHSKQL